MSKSFGNPHTWTWKEFRRYARVVLGLAQLTVNKRITYLRFMEREWGINFHHDPDDIYDDFLNYVEERRDSEGDKVENAIAHSKNAVQTLFEFFGVKEQYQWIKTRKVSSEIVIYPDDVAYSIIYGDYSKDSAVNATYQHMFHFMHYVGPRPPLELVLMQSDDVDYKERKIGIWQPKVRKVRVNVLEPFIITSKVDKSLWNYFYNWRSRLEDKPRKEFWLNRYGEPFSPDALRQRLSEYGKKYCPNFYPYLTRHFCTTYRLIQSYRRTGIFDILGVNMFMGHGKLETTMNYVHIAKKILREYEGKSKIGRIRNDKKKLLDRNFMPWKLLPQIVSYVFLESRHAR